jgi:hypothetical protein
MSVGFALLLLGIASGASAQERVPGPRGTFTNPTQQQPQQGQQEQQPQQPQPVRRDDTSLVVGISLTGVAGATLAIVLLRRRARKAAAGRSERSADAAGTTTVVPPPPRQRCLFISYRREDSADVVGRISDRLIDKFGHDAVFRDVDSIPLGQDFRTHLRDAVGRCDVLLVIIGQHWCDTMAGGKRRLDDPRDHLRIEVESALQRDIPVIPVLVQGAVLPEEEDLPEVLRPLAYRNAQPVRSDPDFAGDIERLVHGIEVQFGTARASTGH